jgi:hypothetical protein
VRGAPNRDARVHARAAGLKALLTPSLQRRRRGIISDADPGQDDRATADPDVSADVHGEAALIALRPQRRIARMVGRVDLDRRTDLAIVTRASCGFRSAGREIH